MSLQFDKYLALLCETFFSFFVSILTSSLAGKWFSLFDLEWWLFVVLLRISFLWFMMSIQINYQNFSLHIGRLSLIQRKTTALFLLIWHPNKESKWNSITQGTYLENFPNRITKNFHISYNDIVNIYGSITV